MNDIHFEQTLKGSSKEERSALCKNPLQLLPLGDIRCGEGWLYEQLKLVAESLAKQPFLEEAAPVVLQARAKRIPQWQTQDSCAAELQQSPVYSEEPEELIEMIPMGCGRLRMTCLPVLTDDPYAPRWAEAPVHIPCEQRPASFPLEYDFLEDQTQPQTEQEAPWKPEDER